MTRLCHKIEQLCKGGVPENGHTTFVLARNIITWTDCIEDKRNMSKFNTFEKTKFFISSALEKYKLVTLGSIHVITKCTQNGHTTFVLAKNIITAMAVYFTIISLVNYLLLFSL